MNNLSNIVDIILTPIRYLFSILTHEAFFDYMGVTPLGIACTGIIVLIVMRALLSPVSIGALALYKVRNTNSRAVSPVGRSSYNSNQLSSGDKKLLK